MDADKILSVDIDEGKIEHIKRIIENSWSIDTKVMICNSHKNIYKFIKDVYYENGYIYNGVDIYNVDMHHDLFNNNSKVDCGNWVSHILKEIKGSSITWIANPVSKEAYGFDDSRFSMISEDLSDLDDIDFDVIFLCRSDIWSPPHLDSYFVDLSYDILSTYENVLVEKSVLKERDCSDDIVNIQSMMREFTEREKRASR